MVDLNGAGAPEAELRLNPQPLDLDSKSSGNDLLG